VGWGGRSFLLFRRALPLLPCYFPRLLCHPLSDQTIYAPLDVVFCFSRCSALGLNDLETVEPTEGGEGGDKGGGLAGKELESKRASFFQQIKDMVGKDVSSLLSVPVYFMEPFTNLQKMAEIMEYASLLNQAADQDDEHLRLALCAAFAVSMYPSCERTCKPFNPILGETFQYHDKSLELDFLAEQVSHHPPVGVAHATTPRWSYHITSCPSTTFLGNSIEIFPKGRTRIHFVGSDDTYYVIPPTTKANNIIVGWPWIDSYGTLTVGCSSGAKCELEFTPCGWTGSGRWEVDGYVYSREKVKVLKVYGKWNHSISYVPCDSEGKVSPGKEPVVLWTANPKPEGDKYGFTYFAHKLNSVDDAVDHLLPSDGRRRRDRYLLEKGQQGEAQSAKSTIEEQQRAERREREKRGDTWTPRWFEAKTHHFETFPGEPTPEEFATWDWKGLDFIGHGPDCRDAREDHAGQGFAPWQYPDLHDQQKQMDDQPPPPPSAAATSSSS